MVGQQLFAGQAHYGRKEGMPAGTGMASNTKRTGGGFGASPFTNEAVCVRKPRQIVIGEAQFECWIKRQTGQFPAQFFQYRQLRSQGARIVPSRDSIGVIALRVDTQARLCQPQPRVSKQSPQYQVAILILAQGFIPDAKAANESCAPNYGTGRRVVFKQPFSDDICTSERLIHRVGTILTARAIWHFVTKLSENYVGCTVLRHRTRRSKRARLDIIVSIKEKHIVGFYNLQSVVPARTCSALVRHHLYTYRLAVSIPC